MEGSYMDPGSDSVYMCWLRDSPEGEEEARYCIRGRW